MSTSCNWRTISNSHFMACINYDVLLIAKMRCTQKKKENKNSVRVSRKGVRESPVMRRKTRYLEERVTCYTFVFTVRRCHTWMENSRKSSTIADFNIKIRKQIDPDMPRLLTRVRNITFEQLGKKCSFTNSFMNNFSSKMWKIPFSTFSNLLFFI